MTNPERIKVLKSIFMSPKLMQIRQLQIVVEVWNFGRAGRRGRHKQVSQSQEASVRRPRSGQTLALVRFRLWIVDTHFWNVSDNQQWHFTLLAGLKNFPETTVGLEVISGCNYDEGWRLWMALFYGTRNVNGWYFLEIARLITPFILTRWLSHSLKLCKNVVK